VGRPTQGADSFRLGNFARHKFSGPKRSNNFFHFCRHRYRTNMISSAAGLAQSDLSRANRLVSTFLSSAMIAFFNLAFFYKNNNIAVVMLIIISEVYTLHFRLLEYLANGTY
jgi:hypothetical protein